MSLVETLEWLVKAREYVAEGEGNAWWTSATLSIDQSDGDKTLSTPSFSLKLSKTYKRNTLLIGIALSGKS
jgi:hypothetical protein